MLRIKIGTVCIVSTVHQICTFYFYAEAETEQKKQKQFDCPLPFVFGGVFCTEVESFKLFRWRPQFNGGALRSQRLLSDTVPMKVDTPWGIHKNDHKIEFKGNMFGGTQWKYFQKIHQQNGAASSNVGALQICICPKNWVMSP